MDKNAYQCQWRKENKLLRDCLNESTESDVKSLSDDEREAAFDNNQQDLSEGKDAIHSETSEESSGENEFSCDDDDSFDNLLNENFDNQPSNNGDDISKEIAKWVLRNKITRTASDELLCILRKFGFQDELPKCTQTLVGTPRLCRTEAKCGGDYAYLGLENGIKRILNEQPDLDLPQNHIDLTVNVNGLPVFKSSGSQIWPILCCLHKTTKPFVVALYYGQSKPSNLEEFLKIEKQWYQKRQQRFLCQNNCFYL